MAEGQTPPSVQKPDDPCGHSKIRTYMRDYFIRRLLLILPTLLGVTIIVFAIARLVPGGPLERAIMEAQQFNAASGVSTQVAGQGMALSDDQLQKLKEYYGFDKPVLVSYIDWVTKVVKGDLGSSYPTNRCRMSFRADSLSPGIMA